MCPETNANRRVVRHPPLFSCVSAAVGTGGVINSTGSHDSSMDGAAGTTTSATGPSVTVAQSQSKPGTASGVVAVVSDAATGVGKPGTAGVQTLNGSTVVMNCHIPDSSGSSSQPGAVTLVNNGPVSVSKGSAAVLSAPASTIIRTSSTSGAVISSQPSVKTVPTVTLVRPPMQTPAVTSHSGGSPTTVLTSAAVSVTSTGSLVNKLDSTKTIIQTGGQVVASTVATGTTATMRSPTVLQNLRTSVPSAIAATPPGGIRAIAPQVLAPRLTQPQPNAPNIQNIQLPPGKVVKVNILRAFGSFS